ncbi:MAG: retropepsin-like aspartic protease family protein [Paracoccaceae bacterium]|jgi:aspartyl protease family protein|nr:TIGR02281 family clan AA aspartic protease [Paracoccaceae bacterium]MDA0318320.1 TIGR02281 family clan AA aspartic protease [Pseudomonadota bacterium]MDA0850765.1 TIGR02281 family clan AA aspartic protease [Pseudomonadota bacterium]MDA1296087.1 TIGR02281 family clan AA aspartic protease [Pseudomonadota bacterium]
MEENDFSRLIYLSVLVVAILGSVLISRRGAYGKMFRQAGVWLLIFMGLVAIVASWQDIRQSGQTMSFQQSEDSAIIIPKEIDGHFHLTVTINDRPIEFLVDTGASDIVLTRNDAARVGFDPNRLDYWGMANTANGTVRLATIRLETVRLGEFIDKNIRASVNKAPMEKSLLGMRYLSKFRAIEISNDQMILKR